MKFSLSLLLSSVAHLCVFGVIAIILSGPLNLKREESLASIDVSNISLSFSEVEDSSAQAAISESQTAETQYSNSLKPSGQTPPKFEKLAFGDVPVPPSPEIKPSEDIARFDNAKSALTEENSSKDNSREVPDSTPSPQQANIDALPRLEKKIIPRYPKESRRKLEQGDVVLSINVNENGRVSVPPRVVKSSGYKALDDEAVRAVYKARFTPAFSGGSKVPCDVSLTIKFRLKDEL